MDLACLLRLARNSEGKSLYTKVVDYTLKMMISYLDGHWKEIYGRRWCLILVLIPHLIADPYSSWVPVSDLSLKPKGGVYIVKDKLKFMT